MAPDPSRADVLLVGAGVAAVRCARTLRRRGFAGSILLVGDEPMLPYNRPPLSKELLRDDLPDDLVLAEAESWYERRSVELRLGTRVVRLDAARCEAVLDDGSVVSFGQCLLATGAEPRRPPIPGADRALVLRTLADARRLRAAAQPGETVVIIGGGFIGVEVASSLAARGVRVVIVELADALWGGTFGAELSSWARARLEDAGVVVRTGVAATSIEELGVSVGDDRIEARLVLVAAGVTPRTQLASTAGLDVNDGILTDALHRTSAPSVFAAGDVARVAGTRVEHWHAAREGGERAALAMLGEPVPPARTPWVFTEVAGHQLDVVGAARPASQIQRIGDEERFAFAYLAGDVVEQVAIVDSALPVDEARGLVERGGTMEELERAASGDV
ncbi:MAG TPA: NAD(P)/FAD-dependent oxidoreductase [Candidatus Limnocylindria bacterium]|nr:NAD(P)/FAD-dependent oxidoreductase [Candidatus Limnocylindria bacterium]